MTSPQWPDLNDREELVPKRENVLRQINPKELWFYNGRATLKVFELSSSDNGELSVSRGAILTAYGAYVQRVCESKGRSAGTLSISVDDIENFGSRAVDNYYCGENSQPLGHAYIDYRAATTRDARRTLAQNLLDSSELVFRDDID